MLPLATKMAIWALVVNLHSPTGANWTEKYNGFTTPQECETYAQQLWRPLYEQYGNVPVNQGDLHFTTTCWASAHHHIWKWFVECSFNGACKTRQWDGTE